MVVLQFITQNLDSISFYASITVTVLGFIALIFVLFFWPIISPYYREFLAKLGIVFFRFVAAASAVASKLGTVPPGSPLIEQLWVLTMLMAAFGYMFWELVGLIGDQKYKLAKEKTKEDYAQEIDGLTQDRDDSLWKYISLGRIVSHIRTLANEKLQRIKRTIKESTNTQASLHQTRKALAPTEQIKVILEKLASLLRTEVTSTGGHYDQNFRVGLYAEEDGYLAPIDAFDLNTRSHNPFSSYEAHKDRFRLGNTDNPSHAVRCVMEGSMLIVPDCANHPTFQYFHERQANYLRSMVAYPLHEFSPDGGKPVRAALLLDTNVTDFFQEDGRENVEIYLGEFAVRLALEYAIKGLTS